MFKDNLAEDYRIRGMSMEEAEATAYNDIEERIARTGKNIRSFVPPLQQSHPQLNEVSFDPAECSHKGAVLYATLNARQLYACNTNLDNLSDPSPPRLFFIDGPGGSGKTYLYNTIDSEEKVYKSIDVVLTEDTSDAIYEPKFMHNSCTKFFDPSGMPPHELRLRKGTIVMLLRNLNVSAGLCNGSRLGVEHFVSHTQGCRFVCGSRKGHFVILPRIDIYSDRGLLFRLGRIQFPVRLAFSLSMKKAQGQLFDRIGLCLPDDVFSYGQLLCRVRSKEGLFVYSPRNSLSNVVFTEIL